MSTEFNQAAASYFGLPEGTAVVPSDPGHIAFHVELTSAALVGIAQRMVALALPKPDEAVAAPLRPSLSKEQARDEWNELGDKDKGKYGSFAMYLHDRMLGEDGAP